MISWIIVTIAERRPQLVPALLLALSALCLSAPGASATVLAYAGDPTSNGVEPFSYICQPCTTGGNVFDKSYENFFVPAGQQWTVTGIFATMFFQGGPPGVQMSDVTSAAYEVRSGVVPGNPSGNGGTLLFSGTESTSFGPTFTTVFGPSAKVTVTLGTPIVLTAGEYWFSLSAILSGGTTSYRRLGTYGTDGTNGIGAVLDGGLRWTDDFGGINFLSDQPNQQTNDISLGVIGTTDAASVPEPAGLALFGLGLAALGWRRRRHVKAMRAA